MTESLRAALEDVMALLHLPEKQDPDGTWRPCLCAVHEDARAALASTSIDGVSGTGLEELRRLSDAATPGPWGTSDHREWLTDVGHRRFTVTPPYPGRSEAAHTADVDLIVAAVNWVRAALAKDSPSRA